ncbi:MAG: GlsB/YeaQ/YmgE family stress response membrane protein [Anaerolineae bacterium]|nr:GlsB/YeaQ/YmgE family stress response membrane protein [Anaerolineae bacterium]
MQVITWLIIGAIAGFLASWVVRGRGLGMTGNLVVGLVGAMIGGVLVSLFDKTAFPSFLTEPISISFLDILAGFVGAVIVLLAVGLVYGRRK